MKIIKLSMQGCAPCEAYAPTFDKWAKENPDIQAEAWDIGTTIIEKSWNIKSVPATLFLEDDGKTIIEKTIGVMSYTDIQKMVDSIPDE